MSEASPYEVGPNDVAIIGMSGRFAGCRSVDEYWRRLHDGAEGICTYSDEELLEAGVEPSLLNDPNYVKAGGHLEEMEYFDAGFFGYSPKDAGIMDPQHRHFYECAWEAMEQAGHTSRNFPGAIGVFAGCGPNLYFMLNVMSNPDLVRSVGFFLLRHTGNDRDFMPTGLSYKLNLTGPSIAVQTACSTSLVATHMACQSLLNGECDMALSGGVTINLPHRQGYLHRVNEIHSPDGHCRAFDAQSAGTVVTSGVGVLLLRRLEDAIEDGDTIQAVIKGSAINNDGAGKVGYLAPSVDGHAEVVAEALAIAGLTAEDISYLETHGTGTAVGDPIEITALTEAYRRSTERRQFCPIGSVKSLIGHTDTAAGVASVIKVVESLKHRQIPPSLHYTAPNPRIDFENSPFFVNAELREWESEGRPRRAGISSLGVGGTNAHVILEEAPALAPSSPPQSQDLLVLSAKTPTALEAVTDRLANHLREHPDLNFSDVAHTLQIGREPFEHRRIIAGRDIPNVLEAIEEDDPQRIVTGKTQPGSPSIVFMFPGGGAQYPNMGRELYETQPVYRETVDDCLRRLEPHIDFDLRSLMFPDAGDEQEAAEKLQDVTASICSIFIVEYAAAQLWMSWGIEPDVMTGHSLGEYVAACLAGVFSLDDALKIVALRGRIMKNIPGAAMLSVGLPEADVQGLLGPDLDVSAINGPEFCLVSGPSARLTELKQTLEAKEVDCRLLLIAAASHCRLVDPSLDEFRRGLSSVEFHPPQRRYITNVTGTWVRPEDPQDPEYWARHFRQPVRFSQGMAELLDDSNRVLLEVGPGTTLCSLARQQPARPRGTASTMRHPTEDVSDLQHLFTTIGRLWIAGVDIDWIRLRGDQTRRRVALPTYPFERQRYWIEPGQVASVPRKTVAPIRKLENIDDWFTRQSWTPRAIEQDSAPAEDASGITLVFSDKAGFGLSIAERLRAEGRDVIVVREGDAYYKFSDTDFALSPEEGRPGYDTLLAELDEHDRLPSRIIHTWMVTEDESFRPGSSFFHRNQERGYYSLVFLTQALGDLDFQHDLHMDVISNGMQAVDDETVRYPDKATLLGPVKVIPHEFAHITCRSIDIDVPARDQSRQAKSTAADHVQSMVHQLVVECSAAPANEIVAYRGGTRLIETFESAPITAAATSRFRDGGVYLITGGLGGIGLKLAEHLARTHRAKLILLGRKELPDRAHWDDWLNTHGERERTSRRIRTIRQLETLGATVFPAAADVANIERMQAVIAEALDRFGTIHGVLHAAAVLEDGVLQAKSIETMERVFTPKVHGSLLLADLLKDHDLDFFVLFSSTSSILGPAGQVDYTAANCFLNALARTKANRERHFIAIDWGVWNDVGAGREISLRIKGEEVETDFLHRHVEHPLLDECLVDEPEEIVFATDLRVADHWLLDEHRTKSRQALIPGTGYLEIARGAFAQATNESRLEICDLSFLAPLAVGDDQTRDMRIGLKREPNRFALEIKSRDRDASGGDAWTIHATGTARSLAESAARTIRLSDIASRCPREVKATNDRPIRLRQSELLAFGPRWDVLKRMLFGEHEALAWLELPDAFRGDLEQYRLHPALLDLATGYALSLIPGYDEQDALYVPLSYDRVRVYGGLTSHVCSHVKADPTNHVDQEVASFDIVITDESGNVIIEIDRFTVRRMKHASSFAALDLESSASPQGHAAHLSAGEKLFLETLENGILADEGIEALERVLAVRDRNLVYVSSIDLPTLIERSDLELTEEAADSGVKFDRPELKSQFEAPRDQIEKTLAEFWEDLLGVNDIGIHDDFFELGGHSLIAVRLFAKIKHTWNVEYPISVLFQAPTIARGAELLRSELGLGLGDEAAETRKPKSTFKYLVPMTAIGPPDTPPFYLVAGMFGNVLNLRHLAAHLGDDQTVYAIQARGLHGDDKPHNRFEDMARDYIEEIRRVQPHGPYFLGGFSGGGITAYEMARQFQAQGEEIGVLVMLDSIPARIPIATRWDRVLIQLVNLRRQGLSYIGTWIKRRYEWETRRFRTEKRELTPAEFRSEEIEAAFREACDTYEMPTYSGKVNLFRPPLQETYLLGRGRMLNHAREYLDHVNHWTPYIKGEIDVHIVTGDHDGMVLEPHVRVLAAELGECLRHARAQCDLNAANPDDSSDDSHARRRPQYQ